MADRLDASAENRVPRAPPIPVFRRGYAWNACHVDISAGRGGWCRFVPTPGPAVGPGPDGDVRPQAQHFRAARVSGERHRSQGRCLDLAQDPNVLNLLRERPEHLQRYRAERRELCVYRAAARLWGSGVPWARALSIASDAMSEAAAEA